MANVLRKVKTVLRREFSGSTTEISLTVPRHRVGGMLIWKGFGALEPIDRQRRLWDVLDKSLSADERREVSAILTLTPEEFAAARQG